MSRSLETCKVPIGGTVMDALCALDRGAVEIALVVDAAGRMVGTLTDGDIRRALLKGAAMQSPLAPHVQRNFTWVGPGECRADVLDLMQARTIQQVPVLDADGKPIGLHLIHELVGALTRPNWAVIMAGGKGSRLGGITQHVPKPMLPVAGRPILERLVLHLVGFGFRRIYLSVNYMAHVIEEHFGAGERFGCEIRYLREEKPLGTGGSLSLLPEIPTDSLLVLNGDLVTQADIGALLRFHEYGGYQCTVAVRQYCHAVPFGCLRVEDGMIVEIEEKPLITRLINAGMYVMEPAALSLIPINQEFPITELLGRLLQEAQPVGAFELMGDWIDVGLPEQLKVARHGWT